jgi:D-tagatose-1,6-bisphosphate aldolase subunit GatZ/KbaZ
MQSMNDLIDYIIDLRRSGKAQITLLAVCPNSAAVLEAAIKEAAQNNAPMLFAATLNQVDTDGGYTGWTPGEFVRLMNEIAHQYQWNGPLYPCLDHGGPWLKDRHTLEHLSYEETMGRVKESLTACIEAGYTLLHIDPTVDRLLYPGSPVPVEIVVERTVELIAHAEEVIHQRGLPPMAYEVGTEEVHGGLVSFERFEHFLKTLRERLDRQNLLSAWPRFIVAQVGTDLHTTYFDPEAARRLHEIVSPFGSVIKGHYTDWVENPADYPAAGMGGANVGPEFTAEEYLALKDLEIKERALRTYRPQIRSSNFMEVLREAVVESGRWKKWLQAEEIGLPFTDLSMDRQEWLLQTGARYIWTTPAVVEARQRLYENFKGSTLDPHKYVIERIARVMDKYLTQFNLFSTADI